MWDLYVVVVIGGEEKIIKEKVLVYDEEIGDIVWEVLDDFKFSKMKSIMKIMLLVDDLVDLCMMWKLEYELIDLVIFLFKDVEMIYLEVMKVFMNYVDIYFDWF